MVGWFLDTERPADWPSTTILSAGIYVTGSAESLTASAAADWPLAVANCAGVEPPRISYGYETAASQVRSCSGTCPAEYDRSGDRYRQDLYRLPPWAGLVGEDQPWTIQIRS
jgi:hypothetical protein